MISLGRPDEAKIRDFLTDQARQPFSYPEVGSLVSGSVPSIYVEDHNRERLGSGSGTFERAKSAIRSWVMFETTWTEIVPKNPPIEAGTVLAVLARSFGVWTLNPARIIKTVDETGPVERFGFVYGSLPEHSEIGEEQFSVEWRHEDDSVWYDLHGVSRPGRWFTRMVRPMTRLVQKRFARESKAAMLRFVTQADGR